MPELDSDGPHTLAAAICLLAAGEHSVDAGNQEQIAANFYNLCLTDFQGVKENTAVTAFVDDLLKRVIKK